MYFIFLKFRRFWYISISDTIDRDRNTYFKRNYIIYGRNNITRVLIIPCIYISSKKDSTIIYKSDKLSMERNKTIFAIKKKIDAYKYDL